MSCAVAYRIARSAVAVSLVTLVGCSDGFHPVRGRVVWADGSPVTPNLTGGQVTFADKAARLSGIGAIESDGTFRLNCLKKDDGLPPGEYVVTEKFNDEVEGVR